MSQTKFETFLMFPNFSWQFVRQFVHNFFILVIQIQFYLKLIKHVLKDFKVPKYSVRHFSFIFMLLNYPASVCSLFVVIFGLASALLLLWTFIL